MSNGPKDAGVPAGGMGSAGISERDILYDAINLFKASNYFKNPGLPRKSIIQKIEKKLWSLYQANRIQFSMLKESYGYYSKKSDTIKLNIQQKSSIAGTSITLAHEGFHATRVVPADEGLLDEYGARVVGTFYGSELITPGVEFYPKIIHSKQKKVREKLHDTSRIIEIGEQIKWYNKDQLIDYIVGKMPNYRYTVREKFVKKYINKWGGLKNRWSTTKSAYILAVSSDKPLNGTLLLKLLDNVKSTEWPIIKKRLGRYMFLVQRALSKVNDEERVNRILKKIPDLKIKKLHARNYGSDIGRPTGATRKITGLYG